jgi:hypothetical protein
MKLTKRHTAGTRLTVLGIKTTADLDRWIKARPQVNASGESYLMSRFDALKIIVGEDSVTWIMNDLAIEVCA